MTSEDKQPSQPGRPSQPGQPSPGDPGGPGGRLSPGGAEGQARADWAALMGGGGAQDRAAGEPVRADLPAPGGLTAVRGRGQVTLRWDPVPGAIGYAVHRAPTEHGPFTVVDHGGGDVLAVPHGPYADTTPGRGGWYAVAALQTVVAIGPLSRPAATEPTSPPTAWPPGPASPGNSIPHHPAPPFATQPIHPESPSDAAPDLPASRTSLHPGPALDPLSTTPPLSTDPAPPIVDISVTAAAEGVPLHRVWQDMVGSEHLSHLLSADRTGGRVIGDELREALRRVHDELGVRSARAHGILCDDLGVYREVNGEPGHDFTTVDRVYDTIRELGMVPVVEFGYMPRDLAADPSRTVFTYRGIISPPKDWARWADLVRAFTQHLADRYGLEELRESWRFEVWNEANLSVFWSGTPAEYWRLYEETARAVKAVDPALLVGGPATAAVGWIDDQLQVDAPVDFLSTHVYGTLPLDLRPWAGGRPILWTEWGVTATHGSTVNDSVFAATFLLSGMRSAAGRLDALAPWVASDHFEELGRPPRLLHGGFGLLTVGNLAKPKFWALWLAQRLGETELPATLTGDGAGSLVQAWASRHPDGTQAVLVWNGTLDHGRVAGASELDRRVRLQTDLTAAHILRVWRVDAEHGNVAARWPADRDWPSEAEWDELTAADVLAEAEPPRAVLPGEDVVLHLPNPGIALLELRPC
ncbi:GH39 family glycosyl hydrolase [Paractinoplanes rishiriensis]|uniref:Glycosyl hydrolases family 39 N-terminal catalytic domain-containing protein n=1 Tax=Paractinoplanes rishiriensis TaxID=1050105 RepID=A0A919K513_9ACTN|nr:xylan 1,4-beta-xylosidase [Actinoplanes rishiriensis]GIE98703.1 hypothetical protein Ari01nite_61680 [Actinoplanes rishiriensis]